MANKKILIIDDEEDVVISLKNILERKKHYEVSTLTDPRETLAKVHLFKPDVIILDLLMPHLGGVEVCEQLNKDGAGKTTPIIVTSALWKDTDKLKAFKMGIIAYLVKPIEIEVFLAAVEQAIRLKDELT
jgi:DNA-binding response OmpR family regulator